jgi:tellurite resistance protein TerC
MLTWIAIALGILCLFAIDLGLTRHKASRLSIADALLQTGFWITIGMAFGLFIYFYFEYDINSSFGMPSLSGREALSQYVNVFFLERILSFDNLFVMALTFQLLKIPVHLQYRVLFYGLILTVIIRVTIISFGVTLWEQIHWMNYLLAAFLILGAIRAVASLSKKHHYERSRLAEFLQKRLPIDDEIKDGKFFKLVNGKLKFTSLFICLVVVEYSDFILASDSIPATLSVSSNEFILVSATVVSLLGMRALYFVFATALQQLRYIKPTLIIILTLLSIKMLADDYFPVTSADTLLVTSSILLIGVLYSLLHRDRGELPSYPLLENFSRLYDFTYVGFRRIIITLLGVSVLIIGFIFIVTPGPAIIVIPAGLAILASEFVWARLLLKKMKHKFVHYSKETKAYFDRNKPDKNEE